MTILSAAEYLNNYSFYAQQLLRNHPDWQHECFDHPINDAVLNEYWQALSSPINSIDTLKAALRQLRQKTFWHIMYRDLNHQALLSEITYAMSYLAELSCQHAMQFVLHDLKEQFGLPTNQAGKVQDFIIIGMGKLGGQELNVSSDIDLIYLYPESGQTQPQQTHQRTLSNQEFFERAARKITNILAEVTADGFVFRVDLRLRPNGDSGPLVVNFDMLEDYFVSHGRTWERYAWLKARIISQPCLSTLTDYQTMCQRLEKIIYPFVWRKYLDFGALETIRELHQQIAQEIQRRTWRSNLVKDPDQTISASETNIKLGFGGIRQIEFIAQAHQLIRGGREASLRIKPTCQALLACAQLHIITDQEANALIKAYHFLRSLEHRIQYLNDEQTHDLPESTSSLLKISKALGYDTIEQFFITLNQHRHYVQQNFDALFLDKNSTSPTPQPEAEQTADQLMTPLQHFYEQPAFQNLSDKKQQQVVAIFNKAVAYLANITIHQTNNTQITPETAEQTLIRFIRLIESILKRFAYIALFAEFPPVLIRTLDILAASQWAADYLIQHPILLDELINVNTLYSLPNWQELYKNCSVQLSNMLHQGHNDVEQQMHWVREQHHAVLFRLLAQDIDGQHNPESLADQLSALADITTQIGLDVCWQTLCQKKQITNKPTPNIAVIAYGKYGGKELGYGSDLDLVFIYADGDEAWAEDYSRLVQRLNSWLSTRTASGILYETDLRLRPNGAAGLPITNQTAFEQYQTQAAWLWEHQALSRARFCAGATHVGNWFEQLRHTIIALPRNTKQVAQDIKLMRDKMRQAHPETPGMFNIKHSPTGIIDVEFLVQYFVLTYSHQHTELLENKGNIALLQRISDLNLLNINDAQTIATHYRSLRKIQHQLRLQDNNSNLVPIDTIAVCNILAKVWCDFFESNV